jgi:hypothetical protein
LAPSDLPPPAKIRSFSYFLHVIEELQQLPLPDRYLDYLCSKLGQALSTRPARCSENTFSDERKQKAASF